MISKPWSIKKEVFSFLWLSLFYGLYCLSITCPFCPSSRRNTKVTRPPRNICGNNQALERSLIGQLRCWGPGLTAFLFCGGPVYYYIAMWISYVGIIGSTRSYRPNRTSHQKRHSGLRSRPPPLGFQKKIMSWFSTTAWGSPSGRPVSRKKRLGGLVSW